MTSQTPFSRDSGIRRMPGTDDVELHESRHPIVRACATIADSTWFNTAIFAIIVLNAVALGLETYDSIERDAGDGLGLFSDIVLGIFVVEIAIRFTALGLNPRRYLASGWNVFDVIVVGAAFLPGLRENATLLRIARLARIVRVIRLLPDLRVLIAAVGRSIPGVLSLAIMIVLLIYVYAMVGWVIFGDSLPEDYGTVGEAMLTMFVMLSLENLPDSIDAGMAAEGGLTVIFFISYVLVASFLLFNFLIGVIINSMEEARGIERERAARERAEQGLEPLGGSPVERIGQLRTLLDELEGELRSSRPPR